MSEGDGLIWAMHVDETGRGTEVGWDQLAASPSGFVWIHLDLEGPRTQGWLRNESGLAELDADALLAEETRPRSTPMGDALLLILRGVNLNPGADPEDMVAVRIWANATRVITVRRRRLLALEDVKNRLLVGQGPSNPGEFLAQVSDRMVDRMANVVSSIDEALDAVEEASVAGEFGEMRSALAELRHQAILLKRYLSPQRDALSRLTSERLAWLGEPERLALREVLDRTTRYVEDLESARERAAVTQEELASRLAEELGQRMYALSIIAGIFLPLSFATGLLGINVGGIPGAETGWAFLAVCGILVLTAVGELVLFRRLGWL